MAKSVLFPVAVITTLVVISPPVAAPAAPERPQLWSIEVMEGDKAVSRVDLCADRVLQMSFTRPAPQVNGQPCDRLQAPIETAGSYSLRCHVGDQYYRARADVTGDRTRDFTVTMTVKRQDRKEPMYEQVRRYRLVGFCPAGWRVGESAAPGDKQLLDTISGARRPMPPSGG